MTDRYMDARQTCVALVQHAAATLEQANATWVAHGFKGDRAGRSDADFVMFALMLQYTGVCSDALAMADPEGQLQAIDRRLDPKPEATK